MKRLKYISIPVSIVLFATGVQSLDVRPLLRERKTDVHIAAGDPLPAVQSPVRPSTLSLEPRCTSSLVSFSRPVHSWRHYIDRENVISDSPLRAYKYALGQYTADY
ncbi:hypothetical protein EH222_08895 [candidate division KSB1 bacterium]|nr:MAG: hypothetical protein EH222_08895 [candidate division KSB1 bacterium]